MFGLAHAWDVSCGVKRTRLTGALTLLSDVRVIDRLSGRKLLDRFALKC